MRLILIIILSISSSCYCIAQKSDVIDKDKLEGTWVPIDSIYTKMEYKYTCIEITEDTWMTFECVNTLSSNSKCPYTIDRNELRVVCHIQEQSHYKISKLTMNELIFDEYVVKKSGRLKRYRKNVKYVKRE